MKHIKKNLSWFNENVIMLCDKYRTTQCIPLMAIKKASISCTGTGCRVKGWWKWYWRRRKKGATLAVIILRLTDKMPAQERPQPAARTIRLINISFHKEDSTAETELNLFSTSGYLCCATSLGFLIKLAINLINLNTPGIVKYQFQKARIASSIISL